MKVLLFTAASAMSLLAATSASADDGEGWYLRGNAGVGIHTDAEVQGDMTSTMHGNGIQSQVNPAASLGLGYDFGDNWRVELDADTLWTDFGSISQIPSSAAKLRTNTLMLNALYDFDGFGKWEPYVGAGLGLVQGKVNLTAHDFPSAENILTRTPACLGARTLDQAESCDISDKDSGFGWQLMAGLGRQISDNLTWDTHYTYMNGPDLDVEGLRTNGVTGGTTPISAKMSDVGAHTVMTGLRYTFGNRTQSMPKIVAPTPAPAPVRRPDFTCWDGAMVQDASQCAAKPAPAFEVFSCWDGSAVPVGTSCPAEPVVAETFTCWDGSVTYDLSTCAVEPAPVVQQTNLNVCGSSPVAIFDVPTNKAPKQMARLGTMPEFGDSHGLTPTQFYEKLDARFNATANDKAYLNYLFKSMGYSNGWADAQPYMFSEEVLPVGTRGILGLGEQHHYSYSILPTNDHDRQAFRIQSANGVVVHFMKTCGNYMYACE
jgi:OOP family OmpA-OmpF porin